MVKRIDVSSPTYPDTFLLVDDDDYEWATRYKWSIVANGSMKYAVRYDKHSKKIRMHRELLGAKDGQVVDHIDGDTMNNQRANLRLCNGRQNARNRKLHSNNASGFKGVHWRSDVGKWRAQIRANGKVYYLGFFLSPEEAAKAYDEAAVRLHGKYAKTNGMLGTGSDDRH